MGKKIFHVSIFEFNCVGHMVQGLWAHPENNRHRFNDIDYWKRLALIAERGLYDCIFFADVLGVYDGYQNSPRAAIRQAVQIPNNDPSMLIPLMATVTKNLGFILTASTTFETQESIDNRFLTLGKLTNNRVGWNIVTSYLSSAYRNYGANAVLNHEEKYQRAEKLLNASRRCWSRYGESAGISRSTHMDLTPLLCQATNGSPEGIEFAARHLEVILVGGKNRPQIRETISKIIIRAAELGRSRNALKFLVSASIIVAQTESDLRKKLKDYNEFHSREGKLAQAQFGFDVLQYDSNRTVEDLIGTKEQNWQSLEDFTKDTTIKQLTERFSSIPDAAHSCYGTVHTVVGTIQRWVQEDDIDGINLRQHISFESIQDFSELIMPKLQNMGLLRREYPSDFSLRERFFGEGAVPPAPLHERADT